LTQPVLGICVGTQLMCESSEEGNAQCMGIFRTKVRKFKTQQPTEESLPIINCPLSTEKIPHMGWNQITDLRTPLFKDINDGAYIYYVHSYYPELCADTIATSHYINGFSGALGRDNFFGTQFHPEKSGAIGAQIIKNFLEL
ncbi:MAG: imidazole glycerol phosphate synthase subunit HisH, partial [Bacteroidaceae bacterium]|nr:imidazole glycerol phosphate synthase subunit HisH [Bacteroidaceae bacterium]